MLFVFNFWIFLDLLNFFRFFFIFFWIFFLISYLKKKTILDFLIKKKNLWIIFEFFSVFLGFLSKLLRLHYKTYQGYYWRPRIAKNGATQHNKRFFCPKGKKASTEGRRQELEVGLRIGPYLIVPF